MIRFWFRRLLIALGRLVGGLVLLLVWTQLAMLLAGTRGVEVRPISTEIVSLANGAAKWGGAESQVSVFTEVVARSGSSGWIMLMASVIAAGIGIPLGIGLARAHRLRSVLEAVLFPAALMMWLPTFWLATLVVLYLVNVWQQPAYGVGAEGLESWWRIFLPAFVIAVGTIGWQIRAVSQRIRQAMREGHVRAAHIRGQKPKVLFFRGVIRNSLEPVVSGMAHSLPAMLGTLIIVEWVFRYPGIGSMTLEAAREANYGALMLCGASMLLLIVLVRCASEVLHGLVDRQVIKGVGSRLGFTPEEMKH